MVISHRALARVQAVSGLVFAVFLVLHLTAAVSSMLGAEAYDATLSGVRSYYRLPIVEIAGVIGAALVHVGAGVVRMVRRRRERLAKGRAAPVLPWRLRLHRYAGYYLMAAFVGHVVATRAPSLIDGADPDFAFLTQSLWMLPYWFYPYYAGLAFAGGYHLVHGVMAALKVLGVKLPGRTTSPRSPVFWGFAGLWSIAAVGIVLAFGGVIVEANADRVAEWVAYWERLLGT